METLSFSDTDYLVVLTGAGISAESGVKTFRDHDGLWENHRIEDVATPEAFQHNPELVWRFYHQRRQQLKHVAPNPAHHALATLENRLGPNRFFLVTQNVDDLHERGGSQTVLHMHGELLKVRCLQCRQVTHTDADLLPEGRFVHPQCSCGGLLRPHIVWFGEIPFAMEAIQQALARCTHFLAVGTSGVVYPAAGFLAWAKQTGAKTYGINLDAPENHHLFDVFYPGKAGDILPQWVAQIIFPLPRGEGQGEGYKQTL